MRISLFSSVPRSVRAILWASSLAIVACGGDDGGDPAPTDGSVPVADTGVPPADTGVPPVDTGVPIVDTGVPPADTGVPQTDAGPADAGAADAGPTADELAAALKSDGVDVTTRRADIVFAAACQVSATCPPVSTVPECISGNRGMYNEGATKGYSEACLDSVLDLFSCFAQKKCEEFDDLCGPFYDKQVQICP